MEQILVKKREADRAVAEEGDVLWDMWVFPHT
jgi:hypothetical protein